MKAHAMPSLSVALRIGLFASACLALRAEDPDLLFQRARNLPPELRDDARELCFQALKDHPDYDEVRVHLARLYAWDHRYREAREQLRLILGPRPGNLEAREVAVDVELWSDQLEAGLRLCNEGLGSAPVGPAAGLLWRKARILKALGDLPGAYAAVQAALVLDPGLQEARLLRLDLKELLQRDKVALVYTRDTYSRTFQPWNTGSLTLGHHFDGGTVLARATRAERFGAQGTQAELEAYPHLSDHTYAFLNLGRSSSFMFPSTSGAAELYHNFPRGIEASLGLRYLDYQGTTVTVYTGSVGVYAGNALYSLRLNDTPGAAGSSLSGTLSGRWYLEDADTYGYVTVGDGFSQDLLAFNPQAFRLRSRNGSAGFQKRLARRWVLSAGLAFERQEYFPALFQNHVTTTIGIEMRF